MKIGDIVYVIGQLFLLGPGEVIEAEIKHKKGRQWVAYTVKDEPGMWFFSKRHIGRPVFTTKKEAEDGLKEIEDSEKRRIKC